MDLIDELSMGLVQDYRENQKGKLQRTFVSGFYFYFIVRGGRDGELH